MKAPRLEPTLNILIEGSISFDSSFAPNAVDTLGELLREIGVAAANSFEAAPDLYGDSAGTRSTLQILQRSSDAEGHLTLSSVIVTTQLEHLADNFIEINDLHGITGPATKTAQLLVPAGCPQYEAENLDHLLSSYSISIADIVLCAIDINGQVDANEKLSALIQKSLLQGRPVALLDGKERWYLSGHVQLDPYKRHLLSERMCLVDLIDLFFAVLDADRLRALILQVLHGEPAGSSGGHSVRGQLREYFAERPTSGIKGKLPGRIHATLLSLIQGGHGITRAMRSNPMSSWFGVSQIEAMEPDKEAELGFREPSAARLRFEWSDRMANVHAGKYRDVTWLLYLLSSCAVFSAVAGAIYLWVDSKSYFWAYVELLTIASIIAMVAASKRGQWHSKWLFHRSLAEQIRYSRLAYPFLLGCVYSQASDDELYGLATPDPIAWVVHRTFASEGLPSHTERNRVFEPIRAGILLAPYAKSVLEGQKRYHKKTSHEMHVAGHRLHLATMVMFILTTVAVLMHFVIHEKWLLIFTAALPALAAALHGIKIQLEFSRLTATSDEMSSALDEIVQSLDKVTYDTPDDHRNWERRRSLVMSASYLLAGAAARWQDVVKHRNVDLPG